VRLTPNWCHNTLDVTGPPDEIRRFVEHAALRLADLDEEDRAYVNAQHAETEAQAERVATELEPTHVVQPLSFTKDVPEPEDLMERPESGGSLSMPGWYEWRVTNWGTKWDASFSGGSMIAMGQEGMDVEASQESRGAQVVRDAAVYKFDTAWSSPIPWVAAAAQRWPELTLTLQFAEVGSGYAGRVAYRGTECLEEVELSVEDVLAPEERWF
jgi:hypothetical protein